MKMGNSTLAALTPVHQSVLRQLYVLFESRPGEQVATLKRGGASQAKLDKWLAGASPTLKSLEKLATAFNRVIDVAFVDVSERSATTSSSEHDPGDQMPSDEAMKLARMIDDLEPLERARVVGMVQGMHMKASGSHPR